MDSVPLSNRSPKNLEKASEVLRYEIDMLEKLAFAKANDSIDQVTLSNALIESFAIHFRVLYSFFYGRKRANADYLAAEFYEKHGKWPSVRPKPSKLLRRSKRMADKQVVHFTESRLYLSDEDKTWDFESIIDDLKKTLTSFEQSGAFHRDGSKWRRTI